MPESRKAPNTLLATAAAYSETPSTSPRIAILTGTP